MVAEVALRPAGKTGIDERLLRSLDISACWSVMLVVMITAGLVDCSIGRTVYVVVARLGRIALSMMTPSIWIGTVLSNVFLISSTLNTNKRVGYMNCTARWKSLNSHLLILLFIQLSFLLGSKKWGGLFSTSRKWLSFDWMMMIWEICFSRRHMQRSPAIRCSSKRALFFQPDPGIIFNAWSVVIFDYLLGLSISSRSQR